MHDRCWFAAVSLIRANQQRSSGGFTLLASASAPVYDDDVYAIHDVQRTEIAVPRACPVQPTGNPKCPLGSAALGNLYTLCSAFARWRSYACTFLLTENKNARAIYSFTERTIEASGNAVVRVA